MNAPSSLDRRRAARGRRRPGRQLLARDRLAQDQSPRLRRRAEAAGQPVDKRRISIPGSASMPTAASRCSPARPSWVRASRPRSSRSRRRNSTFPSQSLKLVTADTSATAERGLHLRQQFDEGQRHRDPPRRRAGARAADRRRRRSVSTCPAENLRAENGAVIAPDGRQADLRRARRAATCCMCRRKPSSKLKDPATFKVMGQVDAARRYPRQGHRRRRLCAGPAAAGHGACPGRAAAELRRAADGLRHRGGREAARRRQGGARRQFPRRRRRARIPGGQGDAGAVGRREMEGKRATAEAG